MKKLNNYVHNINERVSHKLNNILITRHKIPALLVFQIFKDKLLKDNLDDKAAAIAFNLILSVFPGIIFLFTLLAYVPIEGLTENILELLSEALPPSLFKPAEATIFDIISIQRGGLLSFGFLSAIFFATNGIRTMMVAFNRSYETAEDRGIIKRIFTSFLIAFILVIILLSIIITSVALDIIILRFDHLLGIDNAIIQFTLLVVKYILFLGLFIFTIAITYYIAPAAKTKLSFFSPGVFVASFLCLIFTLSFTFYVNNFDSYNRVYGSIGTLMGIMVWFFMICIMLLIGYELNASIEIARRKFFNKKP